MIGSAAGRWLWGRGRSPEGALPVGVGLLVWGLCVLGAPWESLRGVCGLWWLCCDGTCRSVMGAPLGSCGFRAFGSCSSHLSGFCCAGSEPKRCPLASVPIRQVRVWGKGDWKGACGKMHASLRTRGVWLSAPHPLEPRRVMPWAAGAGTPFSLLGTASALALCRLPQDPAICSLKEPRGLNYYTSIF